MIESLYSNLWGVPVYKENVNYTYSNFDKDTQDFVDKYIENTKPVIGSRGVQVFVD